MDNKQIPPEVSDGLGGINCGWTDTNAGHIKQIEDFVEAVRNNRQPMVSGEDAKKAVEVILGIYESSKQGKEI
jgi:predicted dehydrogenase